MSGIDPGWGNDILPVLATGLAGTIDEIRCQEIFDYSTYDQPDSVRFLSGPAFVLLGGLLFLRRHDDAMRRAAVCLVFAFGMQTVPEVVQLSGGAPVYVPGDPVTAWWWATWLLKLAAARFVLRDGHRVSDDTEATAHRGGLLPYLFLGGSNIALWLELAHPERET